MMDEQSQLTRSYNILCKNKANTDLWDSCLNFYDTRFLILELNILRAIS